MYLSVPSYAPPFPPHFRRLREKRRSFSVSGGPMKNLRINIRLRCKRGSVPREKQQLANATVWDRLRRGNDELCNFPGSLGTTKEKKRQRCNRRYSIWDRLCFPRDVKLTRHAFLPTAMRCWDSCTSKEQSHKYVNLGFVSRKHRY